jgi:hypothetical protein
MYMLNYFILCDTLHWHMPSIHVLIQVGKIIIFLTLNIF